MRARIRRGLPFQRKLATVAVASCFVSNVSFANPSGANVVHGTAAIHQAGNLLQITNSPSAIINWQSFSIGANEITRFIQQSPASAVLNRVTTQNPSSILGALQSNGRVFLINPNGILFGARAQIDVGGLVASTLNLSNEDFLAGRLRFTDVPGAGPVVNQGNITTAAGGNVYLVGPAVANSGIITSPQGEVVLAAGNSAELVNPGTPNLRVEISAPDNQALNLGQIIANAGRIGIFAGLINNSGMIRADTAMATEDGRIVLKATNNTTLAAGSTTRATGSLDIEAGEILVAGNAVSGPQTISATGDITVAATGVGGALLSATGPQTITAGGTLTVQGGVGTGLSAQILGSGQQTINASSIDIVGVRTSSLNRTEIRQTGAGNGQSITATNSITITGGGIVENTAGALTIEAGGDIVVSGFVSTGGAQGSGGPQSITAGGGLLVHGVPESPGGISAFGGQTIKAKYVEVITQGQETSISNHGTGDQIITTFGMNAAGEGLVVRSNDNGFGASVSTAGRQIISVTNADKVVVEGLAASAGIFATGQQTILITGTGANALIVGSTGSSIRSMITGGTQSITAGTSGQLGSISVLGGSGFVGAATIAGGTQVISTTGNVTVSGGSAGNFADARIGSEFSDTNLVLNAGGDVVLRGGTGLTTTANKAVIGSELNSASSITINAGGNVILDAPAGGEARIGSVNGAGDISIQAGANIQLLGGGIDPSTTASVATIGNVTLRADNPGGTISENTKGLIRAGALTTSSNSGTSLTGSNQVASFNATNAATGDIALVNSGNLVVAASNTAPGGKITINSLAGDLSTSGSIAASGGGMANVALTAAGAVNIAHPVTASGTGNIALTGTAITVDDTSVRTGGTVTVTGGSLDVKGVSSGALIEAGNGFNASLSDDLRVRSASAGGGLGGWAAITAGDGPVNITANNVAIEGGKNLIAFAAIAGDSINAYTLGDFTVTGGSGLVSFGLLLSNHDMDLTVGGSLRLQSGTGLGSFARVQALQPGSTISLRFPNLASGGYFVNGVEGRITQGLSGFFSGVAPARFGMTLVVDYGD